MGPEFSFQYRSPTIVSGPGATERLESVITAAGYERALVVCGSTVGHTAAVMDPVLEGMGEIHVETFPKTTPEKRFETALEGLEVARSVDADILVAVGGGSSLDSAKAIAALASRSDPDSALRDFARSGTVDVHSSGLLPIVAIPTTLAGADLSIGGGVNLYPSAANDSLVAGGVSDPGLMPIAAVYDAKLISTTPLDVLAGSAMNGFNKGIETLYSRRKTPITDGTAKEGLATLTEHLPYLDGEIDTLQRILEGMVLVQYGISRPDGSTLSILHAFGHGLSRGYELQQGIAHAVITPHVLEYVFGEVDARRAQIADALGLPEENQQPAAIIDRIRELRGTLELPSSLAEVPGPTRSELTGVAERIVADPILQHGPPGLDPTVADIETVLERAFR